MKQLPPVGLALIAINAVVFGLGALMPGLGNTILSHGALLFPKNDAG